MCYMILVHECGTFYMQDMITLQSIVQNRTFYMYVMCCLQCNHFTFCCVFSVCYVVWCYFYIQAMIKHHKES
jgi:hypothetical protein